MDKVEIRSVIKYLVKKGLNATEIKTDMDQVLSDCAPSYSTVSKWVTLFKHGRDSVEDDPRSGRPASSINAETIEKVRCIVQADRRVRVREIAETMGIGADRVNHILSDELGLAKISMKWTPSRLTSDQKRVRALTCLDCSDLFQKDPDDFLNRYVTADEIRVNYFHPDSKDEPESTDSPPRKVKAMTSAGKVIASVFWDTRGIVFIDYSPQKTETVSAEYFCKLLEELKSCIVLKRPHMKDRRVLFHHDLVTAESDSIVVQKLDDLDFDMLPHLEYAPDLTPSNFHLYRNFHKFLVGKRYSSHDEVVKELNAYFKKLDQSSYYNGVKSLEQRWNKCVLLKGDYIEK